MSRDQQSVTRPAVSADTGRPGVWPGWLALLNTVCIWLIVCGVVVGLPLLYGWAGVLLVVLATLCVASSAREERRS